MGKKNRLTNEWLNEVFDSPFNLVNYAIKQAKVKIEKGDIRTSNPATEILDLIENKNIDNVTDSDGFDDKKVRADSMHVTQTYASSGRRKDPSAYNWSDLR